MTIDNHSGRDDQFDTGPASHAEAHSRIALEQAALFAARLAISRWITTSGATEPAPALPAPAMAQAHFYARAQEQFQQWLGRGGFGQYEDDCADLIKPTMYVVGAQTSVTDLPSAAT